MPFKRFITLTLLLTLLQLFLAKYCQGIPFVYICILPAIIFCMPTSHPTWAICITAFILGMLTDCLADGIPGLNASALLVVALLQKPAIRLIIDPYLVDRDYSFSFHQNGYFRVGAALTLLTLIFFTIYAIFDSAGTRSPAFILTTVLASTAVSLVFGMAVCSLLCPRVRN